MTVQTASYTALPGFAARIVALRNQFAQAVAKRKTYRKTLAELENLTSRDLDDLGISRASIREIAYEAAYGA